MPDPSAKPPPPSEIASIEDLLEIPWLGLRPDLVLFPGPVDFDGQRSWILEDPVRGNNYRLGHAEGELLYRLTVEPKLEFAVRNLYQTTPLRPSSAEIVGFVRMLQRESLARLPADEVVKQAASGKKETEEPDLFRQIMQGNIFFRIPLIRPDRFLNRTLPWVSFLGSPAFKWIYLLIGMTGLILTLQELELYFSSISYLFTPRGWLSFILCLAVLKIGHEFAHAYTAKAMGLHVRSMGLFFIVVWPLLYTDTTDVWKIPNRRRRIRVAAAGVAFESVVAGIALLAWALLPDGVLRSLMFFLSGTSLVSSVFVNLNPFMRYDGYYVLMDLWGIDNLRPRSFALMRHALRRLLLDWRGPAPEIHPHRLRLIIYGFLAGLYRIFIGLTIAAAVYYLFFPILGIIVFLMEIWLFLFRPFWSEAGSVLRNRQHLGSRTRLAVTALVFAGILAALIYPFPRTENAPALLLNRNTADLEAPAQGELISDLPEEGRSVKAGDLLVSLSSDNLVYEMEQIRFDLAQIRASIRSLGSGGTQGAHRKWLLVEAERLKTALEKYREALAQLEIRSPIDGRVMNVHPDLYAGAFVGKGTYLFSVGDPDAYEVKAYLHEQAAGDFQAAENLTAEVRFAAPELPNLEAGFVSRSAFPAQQFPNETLFDITGGPIVSMQDVIGRRPRDAYFMFIFNVASPPDHAVHGMPTSVRIRTRERSVLADGFRSLWRVVTERGLY